MFTKHPKLPSSALFGQFRATAACGCVLFVTLVCSSEHESWRRYDFPAHSQTASNCVRVCVKMCEWIWCGSMKCNGQQNKKNINPARHIVSPQLDRKALNGEWLSWRAGWLGPMAGGPWRSVCMMCRNKCTDAHFAPHTHILQSWPGKWKMKTLPLENLSFSNLSRGFAYFACLPFVVIGEKFWDDRAIDCPCMEITPLIPCFRLCPIPHTCTIMF